MNMLDPQMVQFVKVFFESHDPLGTDLSTRYPFRKRFDHCLRCAAWASRIALAEKADAIVVETAALFHDVGKALEDDKTEHSAVGMRICRDYLMSIGYDELKTEIVCAIVSNHSLHARQPNASLEDKIMSDADVLDETGALAILWDVMASALQPEPSYDKAYERCLHYSGHLRLTLPGQLYTTTARRIAENRLALVDNFLANLEDELCRALKQ
jgi:uncharacterized protein